MAWVNRKPGSAGSAHQKLYQSLLDKCGCQAPARQFQAQGKTCTPVGHALGRWHARGLLEPPA